MNNKAATVQIKNKKTNAQINHSSNREKLKSKMTIARYFSCMYVSAYQKSVAYESVRSPRRNTTSFSPSFTTFFFFDT